MLVLALDSSAVTASCALICDGRTVGSFNVTNKLNHSVTLLPMISSLYNITGIDKSETGLIAVSAGPGSFTGLRIGISTAKGLAFESNIPTVGVSTLEALALNLSGCEGIVICPCMDARRNEYYNALFELKSGKLNRLTEDRAISGEQLAKELAGKKVIVNGDGAVKFRNDFMPDCELAGESALLQNAVSVGIAGIEKFECGGAVDSAKLAPLYLRESGAERKKKEKENESGKDGIVK